MRQTAEKAVPFTKSGAKPQRESEKTYIKTKNIEKRRGKIAGAIRHKARFTIIVKSEPQSLRNVWGIKVLLSRGSTPNIRGMLSPALFPSSFDIEAFLALPS